MSGTGHAGMEAAIANTLEPGETIVVANSGIWGQRVCDLAERYQGVSRTPLLRYSRKQHVELGNILVRSV